MKNFIMFMAAPRSGHTLVAAMINAHPNMVCSNQLNILAKTDWKNKESLFYQIKNGPYQWKESTMVPEMPKGEIMAIGDKTGHRTLTIVNENPIRIEYIKSLTGLEIKWVHVVRNPFDNLSTWARLNHKNRGYERTITVELDEVIDKYEDLSRTMSGLYLSEDILTLYHEDTVDLLGYKLKDICEFFEVPFDDQWRENCGRVVWKKPRITRRDIEWKEYQLEKVRRMTENDMYPWLAGYEYGGCCE